MKEKTKTALAVLVLVILIISPIVTLFIGITVGYKLGIKDTKIIYVQELSSLDFEVPPLTLKGWPK
jgi:membrane protease YdiL (CAAX protease family)